MSILSLSLSQSWSLRFIRHPVVENLSLHFSEQVIVSLREDESEDDADTPSFKKKKKPRTTSSNIFFFCSVCYYFYYFFPIRYCTMFLLNPDRILFFPSELSIPINFYSEFFLTVYLGGTHTHSLISSVSLDNYTHTDSGPFLSGRGLMLFRRSGRGFRWISISLKGPAWIRFLAHRCQSFLYACARAHIPPQGGAFRLPLFGRKKLNPMQNDQKRISWKLLAAQRVSLFLHRFYSSKKKKKIPRLYE